MQAKTSLSLGLSDLGERVLELASTVKFANRSRAGHSLYGGGSSMPVERPICNRLVVGSSPTRRPNFSAPLAALTARRANLGLAPKAGLVPTVIVSLCPKESKVQSDLSQLPIRMPKVR